MYFDIRLWQMTRGLRLPMFGGVALGLLALAVGIARFAFLGQLLAMVFAGRPFQNQLGPIIGTVAMIGLRALLDHTRTMIAHRTAGEVQEVLRGRLFARIVALGPAWFAGARTGGVMLSVVDGVEQLQTFFGQYLPQLAIAVCAPFAIFVFIAFYDLPVAAVLLAAALLALVGPLAVHTADRRTSLARSRAFKAFGEEFLDAIQGLPTLKAFGQSGAFGEKLAEKAWALSRNTFFVLAAGLATRGITDLAIALGAAGGLVLGAWRVSHGEMSLAALLIVLMAGTEIFRPLRDLRSVLHQGMLGQSAAAAIHTLLEAEQPLRSTQNGPAERLEPRIDFEDVGFAYPGGRLPAHSGLAFSVAAGERVGVVGPSGAGKSSIVRLLLREADPQTGRVCIGGRDLRSLSPEAVRAQIALVAQDSTLFYGTVEDNLRLGRPNATITQLEQAAKDANAHDFICALPQGYQTIIGERGTRLSGGQRQRLAIARALLRDAPILILDEALSAVDAENEAVIQQALDRLMQGRTTLILAHRLSSVIGADRILVLDQGRVVESGRHEALMRQGGIYRQLMGGQASETADIAPLTPTTRPVVTAVEADPEPELRPIEADAAEMSWSDTLGTLLGFIRPWRRMLALTVAFGIGRVASFIAVGALGALLIAQVRAGQPLATLSIWLLLMAPITGVLHWLESWLAHDMAYKLLAEMRVALFAKLDKLAPAYLLGRRAGDLVSLATQDVETVEYFYAHTVAPACVAILVPATVLVLMAVIAWPTALVLLPFLGYAMVSPILGRRRIDQLGAEARQALGMLGAHVTETIQGLSDLIAFQATDRRAIGFVKLAGQYRGVRLRLLGDLATQTAALEVATSLGGLAVAAVGAQWVAAGHVAPAMLPLLVLISVAAFLPVSEIAQVGRQLADTIAATRRLGVVHSAPVLVTDGPEAPPPLVGRRLPRLRGRAFRLSATSPGRARGCLISRAARKHRGTCWRFRRRENHDRQPAFAVLGPG